MGRYTDEYETTSLPSHSAFLPTFSAPDGVADPGGSRAGPAGVRHHIAGTVSYGLPAGRGPVLLPFPQPHRRPLVFPAEDPMTSACPPSRH